MRPAPTDMTEAPAPGPHPDDAALLRALDAEAPPDGEAPGGGAVAAHLAACAACRARDALLRADAALVRAALAATADEPPYTWDDVVRRAQGATAPRPERTGAATGPRRTAARAVGRAAPGAGAFARAPLAGGAGWRVAAGLLLAAGVAAAAPRIAAWVRGSGAPGAPARPAPARVAAPAPSTPGAYVTTADVSFAPRGDTLHVAVDAPQRAGTLELARAGADARAARIEVRAAPVDGSPADAASAGGGRPPAPARLLVLPDGVRVRNAAGESASYRLSVPAQVRAVRVVVGAGEPAVVDAARLTSAPVRIPLAPPVPATAPAP